jgi:hypothetical protein
MFCKPELANDGIMSRHLIAGLEIICSASTLQRHLIAILLSYQSEDTHSPGMADNATVSFYYWCLIGVSRMFSQPSWAILKCPLPVMEEQMVQRYIGAILEDAESRLPKMTFEAILYAFLVHYIGLEMQTTDKRKRAVGYFAFVRARGFVIPSSVVTDLQATWTGLKAILY